MPKVHDRPAYRKGGPHLEQLKCKKFIISSFEMGAHAHNTQGNKRMKSSDECVWMISINQFKTKVTGLQCEDEMQTASFSDSTSMYFLCASHNCDKRRDMFLVQFCLFVCGRSGDDEFYGIIKLISSFSTFIFEVFCGKLGSKGGEGGSSNPLLSLWVTIYCRLVNTKEKFILGERVCWRSLF